MDPSVVDTISTFALRALLFEAKLSPKPGLVDPFSNGAHKDMTYTTFLDSSYALAPYFRDYFLLGSNHLGTPQELFQKVRVHGQVAEQAMLAETCGINTHKGANFSLALMLSSVGKLINKQSLQLPFSPAETARVLIYIQQMTADVLPLDFAALDQKKQLSNGEKLYLQYGIKGIRGEAQAGYPVLQTTALPFLRAQVGSGKKPHETFQLLLLLLMATVEDSNLINRGGLRAWKMVKEQAAQLFQTYVTNPTGLQTALTAFDQQLIEVNLSPGGSADLLALSYFFAQLEGFV
ncbi:triphosphoribosyl-dephospho-CoA synthase CitG [Erwinia sp. CPCC 100877]|nr:triphosphoribosyl-dephospho-CoA synthase CitG [Erwinia sp. CPCC 100877]